MSSEKMMILKMLEERKIDAQEASRLLSAIEDGDKKPRAQVRTEMPKPRERFDTPKPSAGYAQNQRPPAAARSAEATSRGGMDDFTSDLSRKFETFARDMEPKLYKLTETVAETTGKVADKISKSLSSAPHAAPAGRYTSVPKPASAPVKLGYADMIERVFEAKVTSGYNELNFSGLNGDVLLQGYNGDKISARIFYRSKKPSAHIEIMQLGSKYFLNYEEDEFDRVCIDAFVPSAMFNSIAVSTVNGAINISATESDYLSVNNLSGSTVLKDIASNDIKADGSNGEMRLSNLKSVNGKFENFNGNVFAEGMDIQNLILTALSGNITMNVANFGAKPEYIWAVETSNAKMTLNLPSSPDLGYHLKAHATLSNIKIGLTGLNYIANSPSFAEAKSINYSEASKIIKLSLETSNAPLVIN